MKAKDEVEQMIFVQQATVSAIAAQGPTEATDQIAACSARGKSTHDGYRIKDRQRFLGFPPTQASLPIRDQALVVIADIHFCSSFLQDDQHNFTNSSSSGLLVKI